MRDNMVTMTIEQALQIIGGYAVRLEFAEKAVADAQAKNKRLADALEQAKADLDSANFGREADKRIIDSLSQKSPQDGQKVG